MDKPGNPTYFGAWLKQRRKTLDLTLAELADLASCAQSTLRKIEAGERRPSKQLAELIACSLQISPDQQATFIRVARGELNLERLAALDRVSSSQSMPAQGARPVSGNLPSLLTPLIGRERELASIRQLLQDPHCRLLTLSGPGGIGKTRLALETARQLTSSFSDGAWFVPLAPLSSDTFLVPAITSALNFRFQDTSQPLSQLLNALKEKNMLLVLDNAEHLLSGVGLFIEILYSAPQVKLLITSRERLNLHGEWVYEVQGLPVPPGGLVDQFESYSSIALFLESARRALAGFKLQDDQRRWVQHICKSMEGMPLGIELAAAWVGLFSPEEIAREIDHNLDFLSVTSRALPERHRSLHATLDHSWNLLDAEEKLALSRLSVFRGRFSREAAEAVCAASLSILASLKNKSLLYRSEDKFFQLHELIRQYAASRLAEGTDEVELVNSRHYDYYCFLAEAADRELKGPNQVEWLNSLEHEYDNFRTAWEWAIKKDRTTPADSNRLALRLAGALRWFWRMRGHFYDGCEWLKESLKLASNKPSAARADALLGIGLLLNGLGNLEAARQPTEESAAIFREVGDRRGLAEALLVDGSTLVWQGETTHGITCLLESRELYRQSGDPWGEAQALFRMGSTLTDFSGDISGLAMLKESAAILDGTGEKYLYISVLTALGIVESGQGDYAAAEKHYERSLAIGREIKHPWGTANALTNLGCVFRIRGEYAFAQSKLEEALKIYQEHGKSPWEVDVLCALAENAIAQGNLSTARGHVQRAADFLVSSENKWLQALVRYFSGLLAYYAGDTENAAVLLEETVALTRQGHYKPDLARSLVALARVRRTQGKVSLAYQLLIEGLSLYQALGHPLGCAIALEELAAVNLVKENKARAIMLFSAAHTLREKMQAPVPPIDRRAYDLVISDTRAQLGETTFTLAWQNGETKPFQELVEEVRKEFETPMHDC